MKKRTSRILAIAMVLAMLVGMIPAAFASSGKVLFEAEQANTNGVNPNVVTGSQFVVETTLNITSISDMGMKFVLGNNASGQPVEVWLGEYAVITVNSSWVATSRSVKTIFPTEICPSDWLSTEARSLCSWIIS